MVAATPKSKQKESAGYSHVLLSRYSSGEPRGVNASGLRKEEAGGSWIFFSFFWKHMLLLQVERWK